MKFDNVRAFWSIISANICIDGDAALTGFYKRLLLNLLCLL